MADVTTVAGVGRRTVGELGARRRRAPARSSPADANRSAGTRASAFRTARSTDSGTAGRYCRTLGASLESRRAAIACAVGPVNGGSPASISYSTVPSE